MNVATGMPPSSRGPVSAVPKSDVQPDHGHNELMLCTAQSLQTQTHLETSR